MELTSLADAGCEITHHFSSGVYAKQVDIPAGLELFQHRHKFDHMSILASGRVLVRRGDERREYIGPAVIEIKAGVHHAVLALTDAVWFCVHHTHEIDPEKIDHEVAEV